MGSRSYTKEFKRQAVELAESLGSSSKAADQLGIPKQSLFTWQSKLIKSSTKSGTDANGVSNDSAVHDELRRLRREVSELRQVNLLLKSAAAFFSQDHLKKNIS